MRGRYTKLQEFPAHSSNVNCLKIGKKSSGVLVTGGDDCKVNMWAIGKSQAIYSLSGHQSPVECVTFDGAEEVVLAGSASGTIKMWDLEEAKVVRTLTGHRSNTLSVDFHPFGEFFASGSLDTNLKVWDIRRKGCIHTYKGHQKGVTSLRFSPDGRWVVSGDEEGVVKLWDLTAGKIMTTFTLHEAKITALEFHPAEFLLATASADKTIRLWDLESMTCVDALGPEATPVRCLAFAGAGAALLGATHEGLRAWRWEPARAIDYVETGWNRVADVSIYEGRLIACSLHGQFLAIHAVDLPAGAGGGAQPEGGGGGIPAGQSLAATSELIRVPPTGPYGLRASASSAAGPGDSFLRAGWHPPGPRDSPFRLAEGDLSQPPATPGAPDYPGPGYGAAYNNNSHDRPGQDAGPSDPHVKAEAAQFMQQMRRVTEELAQGLAIGMLPPGPPPPPIVSGASSGNLLPSSRLGRGANSDSADRDRIRGGNPGSSGGAAAEPGHPGSSASLQQQQQQRSLSPLVMDRRHSGSGPGSSASGPGGPAPWEVEGALRPSASGGTIPVVDVGSSAAAAASGARQPVVSRTPHPHPPMLGAAGAVPHRRSTSPLQALHPPVTPDLASAVGSAAPPAPRENSSLGGGHPPIARTASGGPAMLASAAASTSLMQHAASRNRMAGAALGGGAVGGVPPPSSPPPAVGGGVANRPASGRRASDAMGGGVVGGGGMGGGQDPRPLGLDLGAFLPQGLPPTPSDPYEDEREALREVSDKHRTVLAILQSRQSNLQIVRSFIQRNDPRGAIAAVRRSGDQSVAVDTLAAMTAGRGVALNLDVFAEWLPVIEGLMQSQHDKYIITALDALTLHLRSFGSLIRDTLNASPPPGIDLKFEERRDRCAAVRHGLTRILPHAERAREGSGSRDVGRKVADAVSEMNSICGTGR